MDLKGKTALITGGGSGVGAAIARAYAAAGVRVAIVGRRRAALEAVAASAAAPLIIACADIADRAAVAALVTDLESQLGGIDILVNCAGANIKARSMAELAPEDWDALLATNATGAYNVMRAVLPAMRTRGSGLIISIASVAALRPGPLSGPAYAASKAALIALTRAVGNEERPHGIRTTCISPGEIDTPLLDTRPTPVDAAHRASMMQPEDIAAAALFVAALPPRALVPEIVMMPSSQGYA